MLSNSVIVDSSPFIRRYGWEFVQKNLSKYRYETNIYRFYDTFTKCINTQLPEETLYYECVNILISKKLLGGIITLNPCIQDKTSTIVPLLGTDMMTCPKCKSDVSFVQGCRQGFRCTCGGPFSCKFTKYGEKINQKTWRMAQGVIAAAQSLIVDPKVLELPLCRTLVELSGKEYIYCPDIVHFIINKAEEV